MQIKSPCIITPRLLPGVQVAGSWISIEYSPRPGREGRTRYRYYIDLPEGQPNGYTGDDLESGCQGDSLQSGLESLLSFLAAAGESVAYRDRNGSGGDNADLFPEYIGRWAADHQDELSMLATEIEEAGAGSIIDE